MKNFLIAFLVFLVWSFFGLWLYSWLQPIDNSAHNKDTIANNEAAEVSLSLDDPLQIDESTELPDERIDTIGLIENEDEPAPEITPLTGLKATAPSGDLVFLLSEGISIWKNTDQIKYSVAISDFKYKLNEYLLKHPNEELHIASLYSASENIETPNYGRQRGEKIKNILARAGIPNEKMVLKTVIREIEFDENNMFKNGISFRFQPLDTKRVESSKLSLPETKTIYPKLVYDNIYINEALEDLLAEVKSAINADSNLKVQIIGHTDNIGNANDNYLLGLKFARQVRWYLVTKGKIDPKRIIAISEGESRSIATNRTERGRLLNRRIEVNYIRN